MDCSSVKEQSLVSVTLIFHSVNTSESWNIKQLLRALLSAQAKDVSFSCVCPSAEVNPLK